MFFKSDLGFKRGNESCSGDLWLTLIPYKGIGDTEDAHLLLIFTVAFIYSEMTANVYTCISFIL